MTRPRPYTSTERLTTADYLEALAAELRRPDAGRTQQNLAVAAEAGYSATASGAGPAGGGGGSGTVLTAVEAKADRQDPTAAATLRLLLVLHRIRVDVPAALDGLAGWRGDRPVAMCSEGHVIERGSSRCQWVDPDTGRRCGTRRETILYCENPNHVDDDGRPVRMASGKRRWGSVALDLPGQPTIHECQTCAVYRRKHHRSWGDALRLVTELGTFHSDEEPWGDIAPATTS